jgi:hypothetical protein
VKTFLHCAAWNVTEVGMEPWHIKYKSILAWIRQATYPTLKGGEYIGPDGRGGNKGYPQMDTSVLK